MRLLTLPDPGPLPDPGRYHRPQNAFHGYWVKPERGFPTERVPWLVLWIYVVDLDSETLSVGIAFYKRRLFHLRNLPRSLFDRLPTPSGELSEMQDYRVLVDPVPRAQLAGFSVSVGADAALVKLYQSYSSRTEPLPTLPNLTALPIRKYLRLRLARIFCEGHSTVLKTIRDGNRTPGGSIDSSGQDTNVLERPFRQMVYGMVNIMSSCVEVQFQTERRYDSTAEWQSCSTRDEQKPLTWQTPPAEYWIADILIIPAMEIATTESLHAAIGKAIQLINTRPTQPKPTDDIDPPPTIRALIVSLSAVVVVDICGAKLTYTPHMPLLIRFNQLSSGLCALLEVLYTPAPRPLVTAIPPLPVELWQMVYSHAGYDVKSKLAVTSRLFRGIAYDYGPRIGEWSLQGPLPKHLSLEFMAVADRGVHIIRGKVTHVPFRSEQVEVTTGTDFRAIYRVVLRRPSGEALELQMPLVGVFTKSCW